MTIDRQLQRVRLAGGRTAPVRMASFALLSRTGLRPVPVRPPVPPDPARAPWKIEDESFNVLKNHGYHLEHNFGHGKQYLAQVFVTLNLLAFAFHTVLDSVEALWQQARAVMGTRKGLFADLHTITAYLLFADWRSRCWAMVQGDAPRT